MNLCDQGGCTARATRELWFDNGHTLWMCGHHAARAYPDLPIETRFDLEPAVIVT